MLKQLGILVSIVLCAAVSACNGSPRAEERTRTTVSSAAAPASAGPNLPGEHAAAAGDPERGHALMARFECNRCHDGTGLAEAPREKHCFKCHQEIVRGTFRAPAAVLAGWRRNVNDVQDAPSLVSAGARLQPSWMLRYLSEPHDLRPELTANMPRLALTSEQASDIVAYLMSVSKAPPEVELESANVDRGRELTAAKACNDCHAFTGASGFPEPPRAGAADAPAARARRLAPDLRFTRDRMTGGALVRWLASPKAVKPDTLMPDFGLSADDARDIAAYISTTELQRPAPRPAPERLPVLARRVSFEEVDREVFSVTCRHCHADPDVALGDGGPGNTGGFGFEPRGLNLASYEGIASGLRSRSGERQSVFAKLRDGTPRLLASLLARRDEEAAQPSSHVRGMPLGLPALTPEQIQLVESWIEQGRPR
jgi:cytochrome c2